ncbi:hypothetical protein KKD61_02290 [Patescibacteria group bacterium]|nr:hypothetical protein [Patescibacteria group bacterium]
MKDFLKKLDNFFEVLFVKKAPALPKKWQEWVVKALPWLTLAFGILAIPGLLNFFDSFRMTASQFGMAQRNMTGALINVTISAVQVVMELTAVSFLFKKAKKGWHLLYWSSLLSIVGGIFYFSGTAILMTGVGLYFLYQVKSYYK